MGGLMEGEGVMGGLMRGGSLNLTRLPSPYKAITLDSTPHPRADGALSCLCYDTVPVLF